MHYPDFMQNLPSLDIPFPEDVVRTHAVRTDDALVVYFTIAGHNNSGLFRRHQTRARHEHDHCNN